MTLITLQDGQVVMRDGKVGTEQACCCEEEQCSGPCDNSEDCEEGCICCEGECVPEDEIPAGVCCGPCDNSEDCDEGCECVDGECEEVSCDGIAAGKGWYTDSEKQDFLDFLATAGYSSPTFTPAQPFNDPVPLPYSSPCDQVYYDVNYECCGVSGAGNPCDPSFFTTNILTVTPGNKSPPCNPQLVEAFLWACCEEEPPP